MKRLFRFLKFQTVLNKDLVCISFLFIGYRLIRKASQRKSNIEAYIRSPLTEEDSPTTKVERQVNRQKRVFRNISPCFEIRGKRKGIEYFTMFYNQKAGAPKGGRVHWLLWHLPSEFKGKYELYYNYAKHNYLFVRHSGRKIYDLFVVKQTSKHYWRCMYVNAETQKYECFGYKNTRIIAEYMVELYRENEKES